jgi:hypothetical protein
MRDGGGGRGIAVWINNGRLILTCPDKPLSVYKTIIEEIEVKMLTINTQV